MRLPLTLLGVSVLVAVALVSLVGPRPSDGRSPLVRDERTAPDGSREPTESSAAESSSTRADSPPAIGIRIGDAAVVERRPAPARLRLPSLGLAAAVLPVGVDENGEFDVPAAEHVGWYQFGPQPGDPGAAVLAAHVDHGGREGVFFGLDRLEEGDLVAIEFGDGTTSSFSVTHQVLYDKQALPSDSLFRRQGEPVLHLVTCGGVFDPATRSYRGTRVVTAVPLPVPATSAPATTVALAEPR